MTLGNAPNPTTSDRESIVDRMNLLERHMVSNTTKQMMPIFKQRKGMTVSDGPGTQTQQHIEQRLFESVFQNMYTDGEQEIYRGFLYPTRFLKEDVS
ncbi:hypothetical protein TNIN_66461 [Trichonephila inaurata madagascariensis]|uniref:Uncharacterized protein n=1 Tax=Trichonephila inaurata madagascariensis TaxID=2747483 RepID=A0A8X6YN63_9ARAC|nr:hypothetical protein TNIN_66461 [Trichonephila inaurata madagascariensis]